MYTDYDRVYTNYLMHHGVKGMRWGVKRMLQKMGKRYDSDYSHYGHDLDKKYGKAMQKGIANDKSKIMGMNNKYEIKARRSFDSHKYHNLDYSQDTGKLNAKRALKINNRMSDAFEKNKGTLTKLAANKSRAYSISGKTFLAGAGAIGAAVAISKFGNPNNQKLMNAGRKLMEGGLVAAGFGAAVLPVGLHYSNKQFEAENNIYARTKRSTRV